MGTIYGRSIYSDTIPLSLKESDEFLHALDEAYFGKTDDILEAERLLGELRRPYLGEYGKLKNMKVNSSKEIIAFDRKIEQIFGFGVFSLYINANIAPNAWTVPISYAIDYSTKNRNTVVDANGYKYKKSTNFALNCTITSGLIFNPKFTDEEVLAIILHEIGHNFQAELDHTIAAFTENRVFISFIVNFITLLSGNPTGTINDITTSQAYRRWAEKLKRDFRKLYPLYANVVDFTSWLGSLVGNVSQIMGSVVNVLTLGISGVAGIFAILTNLLIQFQQTGPVGLIFKVAYGYESSAGEKVADNFASMYGYGPALSSALAKMQTHAGKDSDFVMNFVDNVPIWGTIVHTLEMPAEIVAYTFDEHPQTTYRLMDQIKFLENELKREDLDPKMKERILKDIADIKADYKKYMAVANSNDAYIAKKMYNEHLAKKYRRDTSGLKEKDRKRRFKAYDQSYNYIAGNDTGNVDSI